MQPMGNLQCRVVVKRHLPAKFSRWIRGDGRLEFGLQSSRMKRKTNYSGVNRFLSFDIEHIVRRIEKKSIKWFLTTSCFGSSMINKAIQVKHCFKRLFPVFSFCFSLHHNFVFARLGSPAFEALLRLGKRCRNYAGSPDFATGMHFP